jgi:ABC-type lipoprotein release transport system permease subunit
MLPMQAVQVAFLVLAFVVGVIGGVLGAYVGMKVGISKLEIWQEITTTALHSLQGDVRILNEDSLVHDLEVGDLMNLAGLPRKRRQRLRE